MSDKVMLRPVITEDTAIAITDKSKINFRLTIRQVDSNGVKRSVQLKNGLSSDGKTFVALFDDNDTDFEIEVQNLSFIKNMGFGMTYGKKYSFVVRRGTLSVFKALETNGNHLRFLSPNLRTAQLVVDLVAAEGVNRKRAELICSRIRFDMTVEKTEPIVEMIGQVMPIFVKLLNGKTIIISIGRENTVYDLTLMIEDREGIHAEDQRLIFAGRQLVDSKTMGDSGVQKDSTLHLVSRLKGAGDPKASQYNAIRAVSVSSESGQGFGRRGVIGFGHKTDQQFRPAIAALKVEDNYYIEPFFIEFRLKK